MNKMIPEACEMTPMMASRLMGKTTGGLQNGAIILASILSVFLNDRFEIIQCCIDDDCELREDGGRYRQVIVIMDASLSDRTGDIAKFLKAMTFSTIKVFSSVTFTLTDFATTDLLKTEPHNS